MALNSGMVDISFAALAGGDFMRRVDGEIGRLVADVHERPALDKKRTIVVTIDITPEVTEGQCWPEIQGSVETKIPSKVTMKIRGAMTKGGQLLIQDVEPEQLDVELHSNVTPIVPGVGSGSGK